MTDDEAAGEENALFRSGPLRPAFEEEVFRSDVRVSSVSGAEFTAGQTYTGLPCQNRAPTIKSWTKYAQDCCFDVHSSREPAAVSLENTVIQRFEA
ncbi:MAG: hypothetical protein PS018_23305 [bacterium]|nr:hypothetical protein [bacterium]